LKPACGEISKAMFQIIQETTQTVVEEGIIPEAKEEIMVLIAKNEEINGIISGKWGDET
jgi:hypothetical protein